MMRKTCRGTKVSKTLASTRSENEADIQEQVVEATVHTAALPPVVQPGAVGVEALTMSRSP